MDKDKYIGQLLDNRYEILEVIGIGGMAVVYKARCHRLNRLVAVKILKDEYSQDGEFRDRFHAESQVVATLSHPNIVSVYDVSSSSEADFIVMELIDGISLKQYMERKGVLNWKETLHFAIQIAKALEHAHSRGIVHRDIKPHNVMVLKNGSVKVADFGIAQVATGNTSTLTTEALGSVHYISPEQAKGGRVDNRSDIYSLGVVMYEMIAGRVPYDGDTPVNIAIQHINGGAQKPSQYNPNIPTGLEQIIRKAMSLAPNDRYLTATAMLYDMDEFRKTPTMVFAAPVKKEPVEPRVKNETGDTQVLPTGKVRELGEMQSIAQRKAQDHAKDAPVIKQTNKPDRKNVSDEEEEPRSRGTAIAIASCVVVGIVAVVIFCVLWFQGMLSKPEMVSVPYLVGQNYEMLREYPGIVVADQGEEYNSEYAKGEIISQYPHAGVQVKTGTKVWVKISKGPAPTMERVVGLSEEEAKRRIDALQMGLKINVRQENHSTISVGTVLRSEPAEGTTLTSGQTVTLWVSSGPAAVFKKVVNVVGQKYENALTVLHAAGFENVVADYVNSDRPLGEVVKQSVTHANPIDVKTRIVLTVSNGIPEKEEEPPTDEPPVEEPPVEEPPTEEPPTEEPPVEEPPVEEPPVEEPPAEEPPTEDPQPGEGEDPPLDIPVTETVTLEYVFLLPSRDESYTLSIRQGDKVIVENAMIEPNTTTMIMTLTGNGTQYYDLYIDGDLFATEMVEFEPDD